MWTYWDNPLEYTNMLRDHLWLETLLSGILSSVILFFPRVNPLHLGLVWHVLLLACFSIHLFQITTAHNWERALSYMAVVRLWFAYAGSPKLTTMMNTIFLVCECFVLYYNDVFDFPRAVFAYLLVCLCAWFQEKSLESEARALLHVEVAQNGESRVHAILSHRCDAVLELDERFAITTEPLQFAAIVRHGAKCQGRSFTDFIVGEDQLQLTRFLETNADGSVNSCSVKLLVPPCSTVSVTLWHTSSCCFDGRRRHLVGLQECQVEAQCAPLPLSAATWQQKTRQIRGSKLSSHRRRRNLTPQQQLNANQDISHKPIDANPSEVVIKVDADEEDLPIHGLTVGAQLLLGPSAGVGSSLAQFIPHMDPLLGWVQENVNWYLSGALDEELPPKHFDLVMQTHDSSAQRPFRCNMTFDDETTLNHVFMIFRPRIRDSISTGSNSSSSYSSSSSSSSSSRKRQSKKRG